MDRHVIANMGTEMGATTTVSPSDHRTRQYLADQGREQDWEEWAADEEAEYDHRDEIDLSVLEPLIALPSSPGNVDPGAARRLRGPGPTDPRRRPPPPGRVQRVHPDGAGAGHREELPPDRAPEFPRRSGAWEDAVYLCSPETAPASALEGRIADPPRMGKAMEHPRVDEAGNGWAAIEMFIPPRRSPGRPNS